MWPGLCHPSPGSHFTSCPSPFLPLHSFQLWTGKSHKQWRWFSRQVALAHCVFGSSRSFSEILKGTEAGWGEWCWVSPPPPHLNQSTLSLCCFTSQLPCSFIWKKRKSHFYCLISFFNSLNCSKDKVVAEYIKYADVICLRNTRMYYFTDYLNQFISDMEDRGRKRNKTVIQLQLVEGLFYWPNSVTDSPIQLNHLQTHYMHLPRWRQQWPFNVLFF